MFVPAARVTGVLTVRQASQLLVGANVAVVAAASPTFTETVRDCTGWAPAA